MKLSKIKIEEMVHKIEDFLKKHDLLGDVCIYFNNKRHLWKQNYKTDEYILREEDDISPLDYFEYANEKHILSMSFEGAFYHVLNGWDKYSGKMQEKFMNILEEYGLYYELGNAWNLSCYPSEIEYDEIEYTLYEKDPEPEFIYIHKENVLPELKNIMIAWYRLSEKTGDIGSCVIGAGYKFKYKGKPYKMSACSPWQGSISWEKHIETIKQMLINIGATEIYYDYGRMD